MNGSYLFLSSAVECNNKINQIENQMFTISVFYCSYESDPSSPVSPIVTFQQERKAAVESAVEKASSNPVKIPPEAYPDWFRAAWSRSPVAGRTDFVGDNPLFSHCKIKKSKSYNGYKMIVSYHRSIFFFFL